MLFFCERLTLSNYSVISTGCCWFWHVEVRDLWLGRMKEVWHIQELRRLPSFSVSQAWKREWGEVAGCDQLRRDDPYLLQCLCQLHRQALDQWSPNLVLGLWRTAGFLFCQVAGRWSFSHNEKCYGKNAPWSLATESFFFHIWKWKFWHMAWLRDEHAKHSREKSTFSFVWGFYWRIVQ